MKIAYVSDAIYPYNKGGKEKRLYDISTRLAARGHTVDMYCMKWWDSPELHRLENGVHLHAISPYYPLYDGERRSIKQGILFGLHCLKLLFARFDVIDVDSMPFFPILFTRIVCWLRLKRMYATWHEVWGLSYWREYLGAKGVVAFFIEWLSTRLPDYIISVSPLTTRRLDTHMHRRRGVETISCGIDSAHIRSVRPSPHTTDVLYAGRLLKHKNVPMLLQALYLLIEKGVEVRTLIVGHGPEKENLVEQAESLQLGESIEFIDFLPHHDDILARMKSAKVFVLPSEREGFGLAAIEANACGIPFITLDSPTNATTYLAEKGNGWVFRDIEGLATLIEKVLATHPDVASSADVVEEYVWDRIIEALEGYYKLDTLS